MFDYRNHATLLSLSIDCSRARPGRFPAHVDDIGALRDHFRSVRDGGVALEKSPAIRKRVRRDVQNPHDPASCGEIKSFARNFPLRRTHHG